MTLKETYFHSDDYYEGYNDGQLHMQESMYKIERQLFFLGLGIGIVGALLIVSIITLFSL